MVNTNQYISFKNIVIWWLALLFLIILSGCGKNENTTHVDSSIESVSSDTTSKYAPSNAWGDEPIAMIRIDGKYYSCTEYPVEAPNDSQIIGHITSVRPDDSEIWWCTQDNQASAHFPNFLNAPYALVDGEIIIRHGKEWHRLCEAEWTEPTVTN
jgi:hypothetical protein